MPTKECNRNFDSSPEEFSCGRKITGDQKAMLHKLIKNNPTCSSSKVSEMAQSTCGYISITIRHINRFRVEWGLSRGKGRPSKSDLNNNDNNLLPCKPQSHIGTKIFDDWMEQEGAFSEINILLKESIQIHQTEHPEDSFPLLRHKDITILRMFKALFYAPLYDIGKLTEYDIKEHALETIISRGYQSSTLNQFLGQLERIDAGKALIPSLIPKETEKIGNLCYIDGHMIAYWSTTSMHKGKITMLGRIMPGSNAIVAHNENGHSIFVEYQPPDIRLPKIILDYCESIVSLTGINLFVIDREINSVAMASAFDDRKWGLLSMLDKNEYKDVKKTMKQCSAR